MNNFLWITYICYRNILRTMKGVQNCEFLAVISSDGAGACTRPEISYVNVWDHVFQHRQVRS